MRQPAALELARARCSPRRRARRTLVSVTVPVELGRPVRRRVRLPPRGGPLVLLGAARPRRFALAALGVAHEVVLAGPSRFARRRRARAREAAATRLVEEPAGLPAGAGPGLGRRLRLRPRRAPRAPQWSSLPPALLVLPELSLRRSGGATYLTAQRRGPARATIRTRPSRALAARLAGLRERAAAAARPASDRRGADRAAPCRRSASKRSVARGGRADPRRRADEGGARPRGASSRRLGRPRSRGAVRRPARAVPVLLLLLLRLARGRLPRRQPGAARAPHRRRRRDRGAGRLDPAQRRPAGRRPPRRAAPALSDKDRARARRSSSARIERIAARRTRSGSRPPPSQSLVKVANIQHLATPIHAQLAEPRSAVELAGTPASDAGRRRRASRRALARDRRARGARPRLVRGARSAGWTPPRTASSASRFARALLRDRDGPPLRGHRDRRRLRSRAAELAETEVKLEALLPLLAGYGAQPSLTMSTAVPSCHIASSSSSAQGGPRRERARHRPASRAAPAGCELEAMNHFRSSASPSASGFVAPSRIARLAAATERGARRASRSAVACASAASSRRRRRPDAPGRAPAPRWASTDGPRGSARAPARPRGAAGRRWVPPRTGAEAERHLG